MTEHDDLPTTVTLMLWSLLSAGKVAGMLVIGFALAVGAAFAWEIF